jgi:hypothetical protein
MDSALSFQPDAAVSSILIETQSCIETFIESTVSSVDAMCENMYSTVDTASDTIRFFIDEPEASCSIFSAMLARLAKCADALRRFFKKQCSILHEIAHEFFHWLITDFISPLIRPKKRKRCSAFSVKNVVILFPNPQMRSLTIRFTETAIRIRFVFLLHNHERGSEDSSSECIFDICNFLTA